MHYRELSIPTPIRQAKPAEEIHPWHAKIACKIGKHPVKFCHFLAVKKVIYHTLNPDNVRVIFYNPSKVFCRCCSTLLERSNFSAKAIKELEQLTRNPLAGWIRRPIEEEQGYFPPGLQIVRFPPTGDERK